MPGSKLSGSGSRRTPRHPWTIEQKRCLLVLFPSQLTLEETAAIFNKIFGQEINSRDFPNGLPYSSLLAQYREHRQSDNVSWLKITKPDSWETESARREELTIKIRRNLCISDGDAPSATQRNVAISPDPISASRKRKANMLRDDESGQSGSEAVATARQTPSKAARFAQMVMVHSSEAKARAAYLVVDEDDPGNSTSRQVSTLIAPRTPKKSPRTMPEGFTRMGPLQPAGFAMFKRPSGSPIWLRPEEKARALQGWIPPTKQEAHPPLAGLFFRFWDDNHSRAKMMSDGIVAEKYASSNCVPRSPPPVEYLDATDVLNHLDQQEKETPFVSVSDSLVWCLSKVLKKAKEGKWTNAQVSVINAHKLQTNAVFHALPLYRQLQEMWALRNKTAYGVSAHEFLVWNKVPNAAIVKTFAISDIIQAAANSPALGRVLRLESLSMSGDYQQAVRRRLQQNNVALSATVASGLAGVAIFIGLTSASSFESHCYIVNELVSGYGLVIEYLSEEDWQARAAAYAHAFCRQSEEPVTVRDQQKLKSAFLDGTCLGATKQFRWSKLLPDSPQRVQKTAQRIGLTNRGRVASSECDAAKLYLAMEQVKQRRLLERRPSDWLLADSADGGSVFEMNDDGVVV